MHEIFKTHVDSLHDKFEALMQMSPVLLASLPKAIPQSGIYLFSEGEKHLYVGRSKRIRARLRFHSGTALDAPFAFKLAREKTGNQKAAYSANGSRKALLQTEAFQIAYREAKDRIKCMHIRFVEESDPVRQALLEIYATISLDALYNDFDTH